MSLAPRNERTNMSSTTTRSKQAPMSQESVGPFNPWTAARAATDYMVDTWQRTILTWDVLRERGNQYLEHHKSGSPPVLVFDYETILDGRDLPRPVNYALLRIK